MVLFCAIWRLLQLLLLAVLAAPKNDNNFDRNARFSSAGFFSELCFQRDNFCASCALTFVQEEFSTDFFQTWSPVLTV